MPQRTPRRNPPEAEPEGADDLGRLLATWDAPEPSRALDERTLASYRARAGRRSAWWRLVAGSVRVPVPVAAAAVVLLILSTTLALRGNTGPEASSNTPTMVSLHPEAPIVSRTSLAGFQPVAELDVTIVPEDEAP